MCYLTIYLESFKNRPWKEKLLLAETLVLLLKTEETHRDMFTIVQYRVWEEES